MLWKIFNVDCLCATHWLQTKYCSFGTSCNFVCILVWDILFACRIGNFYLTFLTNHLYWNKNTKVTATLLHHELKIDLHLYKASGRFSLTWISQISFWVLVSEALLNLNYKTLRETNCLSEHRLSDLLLLCLPKLNWSSTKSGLGGIPQTIPIAGVRCSSQLELSVDLTKSTVLHFHKIWNLDPKHCDQEGHPQTTRIRTMDNPWWYRLTSFFVFCQFNLNLQNATQTTF